MQAMMIQWHNRMCVRYDPVSAASLKQDRDAGKGDAIEWTGAHGMVRVDAADSSIAQRAPPYSIRTKRLLWDIENTEKKLPYEHPFL